MGNKIEVEFVRSSDGTIDMNGTLARWSNDLSKFAASELADLDVIKDAVAKVWEANPGLKSMNLDAIASYAISHIKGVSPTAFNDVSERIKEFVRADTDSYALTKGKGGGVQLLERLTAEERVKVLAQREKATTKAAEKAAAKAA